MKSMLIACVVALTATAFADMTPEARERAKENMIRRTGGFLYKDKEKSGKFGIILATQTIKREEISATVDEIEKFVRINVALSESGAIAFGGEDALLLSSGVQAAVIIVDDPKLPTLLVAPESRWGYLNVAKLNDSDTTRPRFVNRVQRELWRCLGIVAGAYCSNTEHCLMAPVFSVDDLDHVDGQMFSPATLMATDKPLKKMGITPIRRVPYRRACQEGWAPAPTNDVQKKIWGEVHTIPTKPMTIKYNPANKKGVVEQK